MQFLRSQRVEVMFPEATPPGPAPQPSILSRAQRAHYRLSWAQRLWRNARASTASRPIIKLFGVPDAFAAFLDIPAA